MNDGLTSKERLFLLQVLKVSSFRGEIAEFVAGLKKKLADSAKEKPKDE